jgi:hypothetical protein
MNCARPYAASTRPAWPPAASAPPSRDWPAAARSPSTLRVQVKERLPEAVEVSAYYVVAEALTNAAKHSRALAVSVEVEVDRDVLQIAVKDDGVGGAALAHGTGLVGLKDRWRRSAGGSSSTARPGRGLACGRSSPSPPRMTASSPVGPAPETARDRSGPCCACGGRAGRRRVRFSASGGGSGERGRL